jgi:hypothetical protein
MWRDGISENKDMTIEHKSHLGWSHNTFCNTHNPISTKLGKEFEANIEQAN